MEAIKGRVIRPTTSSLPFGNVASQVPFPFRVTPLRLRPRTPFGRPRESSIASRKGQEQPGEQESQRRGEEAKRAKSMQDERLQVEKIKRGREHQPDHNDQKSPHPRVTKSRQDGQAENGEVSDRSEGGSRNTPELRIRAPEDGRAAEGRATDRVVAGQMRHRQESRIPQPEEGDNRERPGQNW